MRGQQERGNTRGLTGMNKVDRLSVWVGLPTDLSASKQSKVQQNWSRIHREEEV